MVAVATVVGDVVVARGFIGVPLCDIGENPTIAEFNPYKMNQWKIKIKLKMFIKKSI